MTRKRRRLYILGLFLLGLGTATALTLAAFQDNLVFFYSPSDLDKKQITAERTIRVGGLVEQGSVERGGGRPGIRFRVTDLEKSIPVAYVGMLPDLFREGQGVIATGKMSADGVFQASEILAKHDENYMPPEVADALKRAGRWQEKTGDGK